MKRRVLVLAAVGLVAGLLSVLAWDRWGASGPYRPPWALARPESQGLDGAALLDLRQTLIRRDTAALLIAHEGKIVEEWYRGLGTRSRRYGTASLAKAVAGGLAVAVALCDGLMTLDDPAGTYIPAWRADPRKADITIRQLTTHSSGLAHGGAESGGQASPWAEAFWGRSPDLFELLLRDAPVLFDPGSAYAYSGPAYGALAYAVTSALRGTAHPDVRTLLRERIMAPLGVPDDDWSIGYGRDFEQDGLRLQALWSGGSYTARATARVGQLMLERGRWSGKPLLRPDCVDAVLSYAGTPLPESWRDRRHPAPAAGWWTNTLGAWPSLPKDAVAGIGAGHQVLLVVPSLGLVVVRYGEALGDAHWGGDFWIALERFLFQPLMEALREPS